MQYLTVFLRLLIQSKGMVSTNTLRGGLVHKWVPRHRGRGDARKLRGTALAVRLGRPVSPDHEAVRRNDLHEVKSSKLTAARLLGSHF